MTIACAATENATASAFGTPLTIRIAAPAPACVAAPAHASEANLILPDLKQATFGPIRRRSSPRDPAK